MKRNPPGEKLECKPLSKATLPDIELLFGKNGACGGCWCMYWRLAHNEYEEGKGKENKSQLLNLVKKQLPLGIIAYYLDQPVGWCSISPRSSLVRLGNSRILSLLDDIQVWSITCLFIKKEFRKHGHSVSIIRAATSYAFQHGAPCVEAYPIASSKKIADAFAFIGFERSFKKAGFSNIKKASDTRSIMRIFNQD